MNVFQIINPCPELRDVVEAFWYSRVSLRAPLLQDLQTPILQSLTFNLEGLPETVLKDDGALMLDKNAYLIGQPLSRRISQSNAQGIHILGVKFTHLGLWNLTGIHMPDVSNAVTDASEIWGREINVLHEQLLHQTTLAERVRLLEDFLKQKRKPMRHHDRTGQLKHILELVDQHRIFSLPQLREQAFISKKTLERTFLEYLGISPKKYVNLMRFNMVARYIGQETGPIDWEAISLEFGYYDPSHLFRDCQRFAGKLPTELSGDPALPTHTGELKQLLK